MSMNIYEEAVEYLDNLYEEKVTAKQAAAIGTGAVVVTGLTALTIKKMKDRRERINKVEHYYMVKDNKFIPFSQLHRVMSKSFSASSSGYGLTYDSSYGFGADVSKRNNSSKVYEYIDEKNRTVCKVMYSSGKSSSHTATLGTVNDKSIAISISPSFKKYGSYYLAKVESVFGVESSDSKSWLKEEYNKLPKEFK